MPSTLNFICTYVHASPQTRERRLQQLTLYQQQWLASGMTDRRAARLQHGQPAASPSVRDDRLRERLDFLVTKISEQFILPLHECMCVTVSWYLTEYEILLTISNCACTRIDPKRVRSRSPTMLSIPLVSELL